MDWRAEARLFAELYEARGELAQLERGMTLLTPERRQTVAPHAEELRRKIADLEARLS